MDLKVPYLIVGAGFFGSVLAERISRVLKKNVLVIDSRHHIGGNAYSVSDSSSGIIEHKYGSHIFHTSNKEVWDYLAQFTRFNDYRHRVLSRYQNELYSMPINLLTINKFYQKNFNAEQALAFIKEKLSETAQSNFEEKALSMVGHDLYQAFFYGYTQKQWQTDPKLLPASTFSRLPVRFDENTFYFDDLYQGIPEEGYTPIFEKMLRHPLIEVQLATDFFAIKNQIPKETKVIFTGPIDRYFNYQAGELGWRTLDFKKSVLKTKNFQNNTVVNYPELSYPYTRIHEFKHYHPNRWDNLEQTVIYEEYSKLARVKDEPYYPINRPEDQARMYHYKKLASLEKNVFFGGRLGNYSYYDMHHVIALALKMFKEKLQTHES